MKKYRYIYIVIGVGKSNFTIQGIFTRLKYAKDFVEKEDELISDNYIFEKSLFRKMWIYKFVGNKRIKKIVFPYIIIEKIKIKK